MVLVWIIVILAAAVIEAMGPSFVSICFSIAGIFALIATFLGFGLPVQLLVFVIALALVMYFLIPVMRRLAKLNVEKDQEYVKTNLDLIIGQKAAVLEDISYLHDGAVKVDGKEWTAKTQDKEKVFKKGEVVTIKAIKGSKVEVE